MDSSRDLLFVFRVHMNKKEVIALSIWT